MSEINATTRQEREESPALKETRAVDMLRFAALVLLLVTMILVSCGVYAYMRYNERYKFEIAFHDSAFQVLDSFHQALERSLGALDTLSVGITSIAVATNQSFPFVTVPDFELRGANFRIDSGAQFVIYMPLITDTTRTQWEQYAENNRFQIDKAFKNDERYRTQQDAYLRVSSEQDRALLPQVIDYSLTVEKQNEHSVFDDGTGYHPTIWSNGAVNPQGDEPEGSGPYMPLWQTR